MNGGGKFDQRIAGWNFRTTISAAPTQGEVADDRRKAPIGNGRTAMRAVRTRAKKVAASARRIIDETPQGWPAMNDDVQKAAGEGAGDKRQNCEDDLVQGSINVEASPVCLSCVAPYANWGLRLTCL